jgi:hypothetical protein
MNVDLPTPVSPNNKILISRFTEQSGSTLKDNFFSGVVIDIFLSTFICWFDGTKKKKNVILE